MVQEKILFPTERKTIDGRVVESTVLPGLFSLRLKTRLMKKIFPSLGKFISAIKADQIKAEKKSLLDFLECLDMQEVGAAFAEITSNIEPEELQQIVLEMFTNTRMDGKLLGNEDIFNMVFAGKLSLMYKVFLFVAEVNYGDFLDLLRTGLTQAAKPVAETKKSTAQSRKSSADLATT
jgi:hypothetical protein